MLGVLQYVSVGPQGTTSLELCYGGSTASGNRLPYFLLYDVIRVRMFC